jgi:hypothetical protein
MAMERQPLRAPKLHECNTALFTAEMSLHSGKSM